MYSDLERGLPCEECEELGEKGRMIALDEELRPDEYEDNCDGPHCHNLKPKLKDLFEGPSILRVKIFRNSSTIKRRKAILCQAWLAFQTRLLLQVRRMKLQHHLLTTSQHHRTG